MVICYWRHQLPWSLASSRHYQTTSFLQFWLRNCWIHTVHLSVSTDEYNRQDLNKTLVVTLRQRPTLISWWKLCEGAWRGLSKLYLEIAPFLWKEFLELPPWGSRAATLFSSEDVSSQTDGTLREKKNTHMVLRASLRQNLWHKHILTQTHPDTDRNCCCHLLRILSALSISSSKVVFTDRLCGDRSLSAAWPVIFRSAGVGKHLELQPPSIYSTWLGVMDMFSLLLQGYSGSGGKCL